ncbi:putative phenylphosphate carboxylase, alpha subunit [uncultured Desulfobacterium sp.]|jgi:4-hydroxy-3-polyprenylbenzoate decarboxylase|uniref:Putative phenylphosphate carboxylase, alpha subunit n=1 Tax=uncultured Desulfobacterium sp. TaxID=201089 RepID=A0A445MSG6_9BACT|nr:putative phenylphosphate carboxylase, alpha subunit [uncultured Desulfobacterium sp.]
MAFYDLRQFIDKLKETGDVVYIDQEIDWNLEAGAIMRRCNETQTPAPFFEKITGYPRGYRLFGSPLSTFRRLAIAMGMEPDAHYQSFLEEFEKRIKNPKKPILVSDGPCKENILCGNDIDVLKFPVPLIHEGDGGRYIGTWHISATRDLDSEWVNWGMYRLMVHDKNTLGGLMVPTQHIGMMLNKYEAKNKPMEIAIAIGTEPATAIIATCGVPAGTNEMDIVGGFRGEPLEVVKCETVDLVVPATSEIVIEGEVLPNQRMEEGPFGEYTGYQAGGKGPRPVLKIKAITHRNDPILTVSNMGAPVDDSDVCMNVAWASDIRIQLLNAGFPITGVCIPVESSGTIIVVATQKPYNSIANGIASLVWSTKNGKHIPRVIVVEDDIDPTDLKQVIFALGTKCHPIRGTTTVENMPYSPLIPFLNIKEKTYFSSANVVYDCTWPLDWEPKNVPRLASFKGIYPKELQDKVLLNWKNYGF